MREPYTKTIVAFEDSCYNEREYNGSAWIERIMESWNNIPSEYRDTAYVKFGQERYDDNCRLSLQYERPQTPEEIAEDERSNAESIAAQVELEKETLRELLRKYPDTV